MAFAKYTKLAISLIAATIALSGCAKKNNDLKARMNAAGARDINPANSQAADAAAAASGYDTEFTSVSTPTSSGGALSACGK